MTSSGPCGQSSQGSSGADCKANSTSISHPRSLTHPRSPTCSSAYALPANEHDVFEPTRLGNRQAMRCGPRQKVSGSSRHQMPAHERLPRTHARRDGRHCLKIVRRLRRTTRLMTRKRPANAGRLRSGCRDSKPRPSAWQAERGGGDSTTSCLQIDAFSPAWRQVGCP
jgi:hypothetical protein